MGVDAVCASACLKLGLVCDCGASARALHYPLGRNSLPQSTSSGTAVTAAGKKCTIAHPGISLEFTLDVHCRCTRAWA